jgi:hypothetical protein
MLSHFLLPVLFRQFIMTISGNNAEVKNPLPLYKVIKKKKTLAVMRMDVFTCFYRNA